ncbi:MAG: hypothetical protein M1308_20330, partial [Actinobacteria bacterium]|nr:hypothetical protein [Actinomycetota bacterium]
MNSRDRVLKTLNGIIPDKVPKGDVMYHPKIIDEALRLKVKKDYGNALASWMYEDMNLLEFEKQLKFRKLINCDLIAVFPTFGLTSIEESHDKKIINDIFGNTITVIENESKIDHVIKNPKDLDSYNLPDVSKF